MKILHTTISYYPSMGGADECVRLYGEGMVRQGHSVEVFATDLLEHVRFVKLAPEDRKEREIGGVHVRRFWTFNLPRHIYPVSPGMLGALRKAEFDVLHAHCFWYFPVDAAALEAGHRRQRYLMKPSFAERGTDRLFWRFHRAHIAPKVLRNAVIQISTPFERRLMEQSRLPVGEFVTIPPPVDKSRFEKGRGFFTEKGVRSSDEQRIVLGVGRVAEGKGTDLFVAAAERVCEREPDAVFVWIGPDYGLTERLKRHIQAKGLSARIQLLGEVSFEDLDRAYCDADLFFFPTRYETFGIVLAEAMMAGLPVVAASNSAVPDVVREGETGFLHEDGNPKEAADMILRLFRDENLRREMGRAGRARALELYETEQVMNRLEETYTQIRYSCAY